MLELYAWPWDIGLAGFRVFRHRFPWRGFRMSPCQKKDAPYLT
jgi:hypothetical protein